MNSYYSINECAFVLADTRNLMTFLNWTFALRLKNILILAILLVFLPVNAAETVYFPAQCNNWYSNYLAAMNEPSLFQQNTNCAIVEQYRFLWLRTFDAPIAVRVWKEGLNTRLRVIRLGGAGGYGPGRIEYDETVSITQDQWKEFQMLLKKASFWNMDSTENYNGFDGASWVLEGQSGGKYHFVDRWSPTSSTSKRDLEKFKACCEYMQKLAKLKIPSKKYY